MPDILPPPHYLKFAPPDNNLFYFLCYPILSLVRRKPMLLDGSFFFQSAPLDPAILFER
jgi:hypothetical protein